MRSSSHPKWIPIAPDFGRFRTARDAFLSFARSLQRCARTSHKTDKHRQLRNTFLDAESQTRREIWPTLKAAGLLLADLVEQGWSVKIAADVVHVALPVLNGDDQRLAKAFIQQQELMIRNAQLRQPSVQTFIHYMERKRLFKDEFVSIFNLIRDGRSLAKALRYAAKHCTDGNGHQVYDVIQPYLQFVDKRKRCAYTGHRLMDIWRYFRHTWTNQYTSVPGRTMMLLVRDAAAPHHPVIGIASLSSSIIQLSERDKWIGWHPDTFINKLIEHPTDDDAKWLVSIINRALRELYIDDFLREGFLTKTDIKKPTELLIKQLKQEGVTQRNNHNRFTDRGQYETLKRIKPTARRIWKVKAETYLFRSKRAFALADYLSARAMLNQFFGHRPTAQKLSALLATAKGKNIVGKIIRKAKADQVGIAMADLTVCGALPPYNEVLGGKLVSMLAASPEVVREYKRRYQGAISEIASSMAGRPIRRPAELVYLGTTSLYGNHSSQYNRIKIPLEAITGKSTGAVRYCKLGRSEAFGTSHYNQDTITALVALVTHRTGGQRINSIFGEGSSPKLRKVREGIETLCCDSEDLLRHGRQRIIYGIPLIKNLTAFLLGIDTKPRFLIPLSTARATEKISQWWATRWLRMRIQQPQVIQAVAKHTLVEPISHGARVTLPADTEHSAVHCEAPVHDRR